jgi:hypothetical protein
MGHTTSKFKPRQLQSVLRAVAAAGVKVTRIEINASGGIAMLTSNASPALASVEVESLDAELAEFESRKHGHD